MNDNIKKTDFCFIDSGLGGIPYMTTLLERESRASCMYVADTANFPYGKKTHEEIVALVTDLVRRIKNRFDPGVIVLACNTISVNALETLRRDFPGTQFVGTVPAIKLAAGISKKRRIGLLATDATCKNPYNLELKEKFAADCRLVLRGDAELVSFIEHNAFTAGREELLEAVRPAVDFFKAQDCDVIILGCTHFLNIKDVFVEACGSGISVVDSVDGVVRHALEVRKSHGGALWESSSAVSSLPQLFVTELSDTSETAQYKVLCSRFGIDFTGQL